MSYVLKKVDVWAGDFMNRPERLARILEALSAADAELQFLVARRVNENTSRVFLAPLDTKKQRQAATDVGLVPAIGMHAFRVEGNDRGGLGAEITRAVAAAGVNIRGASAATVGKKNVFYLAFKSEEELKSAMKAVKKQLGGKKKK